MIDKWNSLHERIVHSSNYKWYALFVVQIGIFFVGINATIVNLALPEISKSFHEDVSISQLIIIVYSTVIAICLPVAGQIPHFFGRRAVVIVGFLLFTIGSILAAIAPSLGLLIGLQVLLAIGSSALLANSNAITHTVFPNQERGFALGINGTVASIGYGSGLLAGGYLISAFGWRSIYWLNLPFGVFAVVLSLLVLSEKRIGLKHEGKRHPFDYLGALLFALSMGSLMLFFKIGGSEGFYLGLLTIISLGFFILREMRAPFPLIDLRLFKNESTAVGSSTRLLITIISSSILFLIPFYTQHNLEFSPLESGLIMLPFSLALFFFGPLSGTLSRRWGSVWVTSSGFIICGLGLLFLISLNNESEKAFNVIRVSLGMFFTGIGFGIFVPSNNHATLNAVPPIHVGMISGFLWSMAYLGAAAGTALCGAFFSQVKGLEKGGENKQLYDAVSFEIFDAQKIVFLILIFVSILGLLLCFIRRFIKIKTN